MFLLTLKIFSKNMTFLHHYTYFFSIPEENANNVSGILRFAQAKPVETFQNESINTQLNEFLKTYKFEKLVTNYKKIQTFIPKNSFDSNKTTSSTNKLYATLENKNFSSMNPVSDEVGNFKKFTYSKGQVLTKSVNNLINSKEFSKDTILKQRVSASESLLLNHLTYNKFKENLYFKTNNMQAIGSKSTYKQINCNEVTSSQKIRKTWFKNVAWILQNQHHASSNQVQLPLKSTYAIGSDLLIGDSSQVSKLQHERIKMISRFGTYYFLQKLLSKYLDVCNKSSRHVTLLHNSEPIKLDFSMVSLLDLQIPTHRNNSLYFVFTQLNQKTFLSYWLLPVAGLALLTPPLLTLTGEFVSVQKFNSFINKKSDVILFSNTEMFYNGCETPTPFVNINTVKPSMPSASETYVPVSPVLDTEGEQVSNSRQNDLLSIKHCFNNLYNYINNKTELSIKNLFFFSAIKTDATTQKNTQSFFPIVNTTNLINNHNGVKGQFRSSIAARYSIGRSSIGPTNLEHVTNCFSSYLPIPNVNSMSRLTTLPYLNAISPMHSKFIIDHSLKFITPRTTLKLLQKKLSQCPKEIYCKKETLTSPRDLLTSNSFFLDQVNLRTINFFHGNCRPLNNYNEASKLINLYEKNPFEPINFNQTLNFNALVAYLVNKSPLRLTNVNAFNQKCSQIVYKQSLYTMDLLKIPGANTKMGGDFSNGDKLPNKNGILLDYFLYSNLVSDNPNTDFMHQNGKPKITKLKLNLTKITLPFKTLIKKHKFINKLVPNKQIPNNLNLGSRTFNGYLSVVSNANLLTGYYTALARHQGLLPGHRLDKRLNSYLIYLDQNLTKFIQLNHNSLQKKPLSLQKNKLEKATPTEDHYKYTSIRGSKFTYSKRSLQMLVTQRGEAPTAIGGSKQFLNSLTILFKHQKMFKKKISKSNKLNLDTKGLFRKQTKSSFGLVNLSNVTEKNILSARLQIQKKRKAKKQRLETRRQKKRTRFFPRPVWLRYRMFLNFLTERNKYYLNSTVMKPTFSHLGSGVTTATTIPVLQENVLKLKPPTEVSSTIEPPKPFGQAFNNPIFNKILNKSLLSSSQNPLKMSLVANYPKIQLMHKFKKFENKKQNLRDIKMKANYSNFKSQKANNQPQQNDKDKDKDTMFRDFWVWSYNNTQTNTFNQNLWWLLPNLTTKQSNLELLPSSYAKGKNLYVAKAEMNGNGITTASKNSRQVNKFQIALIRLNWALNKTNINTFTDYSKRYNLWTTQKLRNQSKNNKTKYLEKQFITNWEKFFLNKNLSLFSKKILTKVKQKQKKLNYITSYLNVKSEQNFKIFNNSWWTHLNINNLIHNKNIWIPQGEGHLATGNLNADFINSAIIKSINNNTFLEHSLYSPESEKEKTPLQANNFQLVFISSSILLHLCAIISLVSISQVRCFVKFHLILLYKLSNVYNSILNQLSNTLQKKLPVYNNITKWNSRYFYMNHKPSQTQSQKKLLTYFSFTLLKKQFLTIKLVPINKPAKEAVLTPYKAWQHVGAVTKLYPEGERERQSASTKPSKSMYAKLNILSLKTIFLKQLLMNKKSYLSKTNLPPSVGLNLKSEIKQSQLVQRIKTKELHFSLKKNIIGFSTLAKNQIFKIFFNIIEVFQTGVRNISSFFEKPAEFTTTWIAYGFLVEWSSDFITIIPENVDIYVWNVFSKIYRTMPLSLISTTLVPASTLLHPLTNSTIPIKIGYFNNQKMVEFPILLSISHLLHRRILYLFDTLFSTITQPDADLITRQEKGTLFWDIWADFLVTTADYYNVNVAALSTIKAEQNSLIENISNDFDNLTMSSQKGFAVGGKDDLTINTRFWINKFKGTKFKNISLANPEVTVRERKFTLNGFLHIYSPQEETLLKNAHSAKNFSHDKTSLKLFNQLNLQLFVNKNKIKPYFEAYFATTQQKTNMDLMQGFEKLNFLQSTFPEGNLNRWSVNQFITYQSWHSHNGSNNSNGDLFIDYHPPKTFSHIPALKYNSILQQPIGALVCQIYSGLFNKQISKNILLVNPKTTNHNLADYNVLLIQALAGETEMKIITDNAQRYALVNRGFAIGIKLLREVFDAIALNTPCIFLLEDIHAIGERRPMLISDYGGGMSDDNGSFKEDFFGSQRDEVHEKNQVVYQLTRHAITHYKKPFKGDYSLAIPTNLYVTDLFLKLPTQPISNLTNVENHNLSIKNKIQHNGTENKRNLVDNINKNSYLQITQFTKTLAPPSTSPFSVLLLKEEKRLKPNKIVDELPWTGLPGEQLATKPRTSYSVRAKVAMLAELSLSNLSAKLDMITDLLVIIDSVRSNKGFVVFATTDIPHVLDPALRRPGRLDETICLPNINNSNILNFTKNYEIFKSAKHTSTFSQKIILNQIQNLTNTFSLQDINRSYFSTNNQMYTSKHEGNLFTQRGLLTINLKDYNILLNQVYFAEGKGGLLNSSIHKDSQQKSLNFALISYSKKLKELNCANVRHSAYKQKQLVQNSLTYSKKNFKKKYKDKAIIYYEVGKFVLNYFLNNQLTNLSITEVSRRNKSGKLKQNKDITIFGNDFLNLKTINYLSLYNSKNKILLQLMLIFGGKMSQLLSSKNLVKSLKQVSANDPRVNGEIGSIYPAGMPLEQTHLLPKALSVLATPMIFSDGYNNQNLKTATTLLLSFIHKRYLYRKNLIVPKLLSFADGNILDEPPSPPFSSLLIPAKRFENYKRFFRDTLTGDKMGQRKSQITLLEKLQYHMQLRSIKQLNSTFSSYENLDLQSNAALTSQKLDTLMSLSTNNLLQNPTNIHWYYQNRILKRHGQYLTNQWWNGQLSEHNAETVFLSDIDWRSSFIKNKNINITKSKNLYSLTQQKNKTDGLDVLLDFPDTDQYYNPKRRRWLLNKGSWNFWFNFDKLYSEEMVTTWILESLIQTYKYLHKNTELLDFVTNKFITLGYMAPDNTNLQNISGFSGQSELLSTKEIILTNSFKRF